MERMFVETLEFKKEWAGLKLNDDDLGALQRQLLRKPDAGSMMQGAGGVRKLRWARKGRGKSGDCRVIYFDDVKRETIVLLTAYGKNVSDNLTSKEKKELKQFVKSFEKG